MRCEFVSNLVRETNLIIEREPHQCTSPTILMAMALARAVTTAVTILEDANAEVGKILSDLEKEVSVINDDISLESLLAAEVALCVVLTSHMRSYSEGRRKEMH